MSIYFDPSYVEHQSAWKKIGAKFMLGVGDFGDWREWLAAPFPIVTTAHPVGIEFVAISPADGFGKTDGPLDQLVADIEKKQIEEQPQKAVRAEEQRREEGTSALDDSILFTLQGDKEGEIDFPKPKSTKFLARRDDKRAALAEEEDDSADK